MSHFLTSAASFSSLSQNYELFCGESDKYQLVVERKRGTDIKMVSFAFSLFFAFTITLDDTTTSTLRTGVDLSEPTADMANGFKHHESINRLYVVDGFNARKKTFFHGMNANVLYVLEDSENVQRTLQ